MTEGKQLTILKLIGSLCSVGAFIAIGVFYGWKLAGLFALYSFGTAVNIYVVMKRTIDKAMFSQFLGKRPERPEASASNSKRDLF